MADTPSPKPVPDQMTRTAIQIVALLCEEDIAGAAAVIENIPTEEINAVALLLGIGASALLAEIAIEEPTTAGECLARLLDAMLAAGSETP